MDRDPAALAEAGGALADFGERVRLMHSGFDAILDDPEIRGTALDGALLDLGVRWFATDERLRPTRCATCSCTNRARW